MPDSDKPIYQNAKNPPKMLDFKDRFDETAALAFISDINIWVTF
jgi:hypothetical protein